MYLTLKRPLINYIYTIMLLSVLVSSCAEQKRTFVKNFPVNRAFVYENKINITGNLAKDEKKRLTNQLDIYWDDSLKVKKAQVFGFFYKIKSPAVFDSSKFSKTISNMSAYLNAQGYYYPSFNKTYLIDTVKNQIRAHILMDIAPGKSVTIDSIRFDLNDSMLNKITELEINKTSLKQDQTYTKQNISIELDRLVNLYRRNGYFKFTREDIFAYVDSTNHQILELTTDPFEQVDLLKALAKSKFENPKWDVTITRRPTNDSSRIIQYKVRKLYYFPETKITDIPDSLLLNKKLKTYKEGTAEVKYSKGIFRYSPLKENTFFKSGDLYNEEIFYKTANGLSQLGAWQNVDVIPKIHGKDSIDFYFFLTPAVKQSFTINLESSRNTGDIGIGNLLGISTNLTYSNRNVWKRAIQSIASFRTGVELGLLNNTYEQSDLIQSFLFNLGHTYVFPKIIQPFKNFIKIYNLDNPRTLWSINAGYVDRRTFYRQRSFITSWGYEWKKRNNLFIYKPLNIELTSFDYLDSLNSLIQKNPFLLASFNEGNIVSQSLTVNRTIISKRNPNNSNYYRLGIEEAGGILGLIPGLQGKIYRYLKIENEYRHSSKRSKSEIAWRAYGGFGYNYGNDRTIGITLPFYKQFSAGGPNSMRAWSLRQLGLGSSKQSEKDTSNNAFRDRYGDMQLELNFEYRFQLAEIGSFKIASALFTDIGNIWNIKQSEYVDPTTLFSFNNLTKDIAIGVGTGLRFDLSYFLIRLDFAYKLKDPLRVENGGWLKPETFEWTNTRPNGIKIPNFALQFGIGLPF